ncbi:DNA-directed RNA polymerase subunit H [Candidatus Woesearchaeota archaeon]|nr:MAG: DNA-directed RNA polymerase subunit H [Candidatus Woesearchaeota archaeon]
MATKSKIIPQEHILVPKHEKISDKEKEKLMDKYNIIVEDLPRISSKDPAISDIEVKEGDIIRVIRSNKTAYQSIFYRRVIDE